MGGKSDTKLTANVLTKDQNTLGRRMLFSGAVQTDIHILGIGPFFEQLTDSLQINCRRSEMCRIAYK